MKIRPKIIIMKKFILDKHGHFRFRSPNSNYEARNKRPPLVVLSLDPNPQYHYKTGVQYPICLIRTEKQLADLLFRNWGVGEYLVYGSLKGRCGTWVFWRGEIDESGWRFMIKNNKDKDVTAIENEIAKTQDAEEKQSLEEDLKFFKDIAKEEKKATRYGFLPFLRSSGIRGEYHNWEEDDPGLSNNVASNIKKIEKVNRQKENEEINLDEINNF